MCVRHGTSTGTELAGTRTWACDWEPTRVASAFAEHSPEVLLRRWLSQDMDVRLRTSIIPLSHFWALKPPLSPSGVCILLTSAESSQHCCVLSAASNSRCTRS